MPRNMPLKSDVFLKCFLWHLDLNRHVLLGVLTSEGLHLSDAI